jgi:hypothetical protein
VECIISNELKTQEIKLSRVFRLEDNESPAEKNAQVWITDTNQNTYNFSEGESGLYLSDTEFEAVQNLGYTLHITTSDGKKYESREEFLTPEATIDNLYAEKTVVNGKEGIQIYVDSNGDNGFAKYFRYEYEETFKVKTPYTITEDIELTNINLTPSNFRYDIVISPTTEVKQIGYVTNKQKEILQTATLGSTSNDVVKFPIKFIEKDNYSIRERYSISVRQYLQSQDSYNFYKILGQLGSQGNILQENQPGFIQGNIYATNDQEEQVVGLFEVSSVSEKRIFFSHFDFNFSKPPYPYFCEIDTLDYRDNSSFDEDPNDRAIMHNALELVTPPWELLELFYIEETDIDGNIIEIPIYVLLTPECGNCTSFASNIKPEFWED